MLGFGLAGGTLPHGLTTFSGNRIAGLRNTQRKQETFTFFHPSHSKRVTVHCRRGSGGRGRQRGDGRRPNRVGELIRREISPIIDDAFSRAFSFEEQTSPVLVSVVDVKCSDDLRNARVSVSVLGTDEQKTEALRWLRGARKELRFELAQCVHLKHIPELSFDESEMAQAVKTMNILNMLAKEREEKQAMARSRGESKPEFVEAQSASLGGNQDLDMDVTAEDAIIVDDLDDFDGMIDEDDDAEDALIIDVSEDDEDAESMGEEKLQRIPFNASADDEVKR